MGKEGLKLRNKSHVNHKSAINPLWAGEEFFPFLKLSGNPFTM